MKLLTGLLAAMLLLAGAATSHAVVRIANDRGGLIEGDIAPNEGRTGWLSARKYSAMSLGLSLGGCPIREPSGCRQTGVFARSR